MLTFVLGNYWGYRNTGNGAKQKTVHTVDEPE